jgi:two-component system chemotaxis response regulator CheY
MQTQLEHRKPTAARRGATRVLVVDDAADIRELLVDLLESEYYEVSSACDGQQALRTLSVQWPDIILLDLMMPIMSGWQFLHAPAEHPRLACIPVVVLSAFDVFDHQMDVAAAVHPKPFLVDEVLDTVHRLAGRVAPWHMRHSLEEKTK